MVLRKVTLPKLGKNCEFTWTGPVRDRPVQDWQSVDFPIYPPTQSDRTKPYPRRGSSRQVQSLDLVVASMAKQTINVFYRGGCRVDCDTCTYVKACLLVQEKCRMDFRSREKLIALAISSRLCHKR